MKALVYSKSGKIALEDRPKPEITAPGDAIVRVTHTTICGTDLHILKGDVATAKPGRILGHEGVGVVKSVGAAVTSFKKGDHVLMSCVSACGTCSFCRKQMYSHCIHGGWILGNSIDGTQAEFVRTPFAEMSLYHIPEGADEEALVMLSDILPTGLECGVLNGKVAPGSTVAIVGAGPVGLAALLTAQFYSPASIIMIDIDDNRLEIAKKFGATDVVNSAKEKAAEKVMELTDQAGVDTAIEAVGIPATFELCQEIVAAGGTHRQYRRARQTGRPASGNAVGSQHRDHHAARRYRDDPDAVQDGGGENHRPGAPDLAPLHAGRRRGRIRDIRRCRQEQGAESDHQPGLIAASKPEIRWMRHRPPE
jgi:alcohol dehydrogenase